MVLRIMLIVAVGTTVLGQIGDAGAQASSSYEIVQSVIGAGGGRSSSDTYKLAGTLGQPSFAVCCRSASYSLVSGFWGGMVRTFSVAIDSLSYSLAEGARITWHSTAGATYTVYFTNSLTDAWKALVTLAGTGGLMEWLDDGTETGTPPTAAVVLKRFYRLSGLP
jgi:hypothetical protein